MLDFAHSDHFKQPGAIMPTYTITVVPLEEQTTYVGVVFAEQEAIAVRYQRLLTEFDTKLENRLIELRRFSEEQSNFDTIHNESNAIKNHDQRIQYLYAYVKQAEELRNFIASFSTGNKLSEFFSKQMLKKYVGHEFLTEGGYPNDKFRIELLARAIRTIDYPNDANNQKQLGLIHTILPEGISQKLPILLAVSLVLLYVESMIGFFKINAGNIPFTIGLTMFIAGYTGSLCAAAIFMIVEENREFYKIYKDTIPNISKKLQFFTQSKMERNSIQNIVEDNLVYEISSITDVPFINSIP